MKKRLLYSFLLFIIGIFSACEVGLGAAVDTEAPKIDFAENTISSGAVVRDAFAVFGTWEDDGSIGSVTATLASLSGSGFSVEKEGTFDDEKLSWQVVFNPAEDIIPDGSYELVIIIKDTAEHESRISRAITIDNTPPLVVLSRPSTKSTSSSIDSYGQKFTLEGKAADDNDVSLIEVKVYSNPECTGEPLKTITLPNVPLTIESDVATYSKDTPNDYSVIYGHVDASGIAIKDGTSATRYCQLVVYDGAKRYPADGSAQTDSDLKGNSIEYYYLNSDLAELFTDGYKITELYHILNGTYSGSSEAARTISTSSVLDKLKNEANQVKTGKFKINPENSPQFVVSSRNPLPETGMDFSESTITNGNSYLEIEITPGLDGHLIREETVGIYLVRCNNNGALLKADGTPAANENEAKKIWLIETDKHEQQADITMSGSTYKFKTKSQLGTEAFADMVIGENYFIRVVGKDIQGNDILSEGQYGFQLITSGLNIEVGITVSPAWISTNPNANAANKTVNVTLEYPTENKPFDIYRSSNPDALESSSPIATALNGSPYTDSFAVNDTTLPIDSASAAMPTSTVYYIVKGANAAQSNPKNAIFKYDNCPPQVAVTSVPDVLVTEQSTLTFQGTATDWFSASNHTELSGVKKVYVQVYDSAVPANSTPAAGEQNAITASLSDGGWICQIRPADWQGANGAFTARGNKTVKVTVVDGVGLTAEATSTFVYDTASPTVSLNNNWYQFATAAGGQITDENVITGSNVTIPSVVGKVIKLSGTAGDDYGLQSIIIEQKKLGGETVRFEMPALASASTNFVTPHLPLKSTGILVNGLTDVYQGSEFSAAEIGNPSTVDGTYTYIIIAKDVTGKEIKSEQKTITLYTAAPTVSITNPAENEWQTLNNVTISGTALSQEAIAGVFYKFSATQPSLPENPAEASSWTGAGWTSAAGTNSWTKTMNMNDATANSYVLWVGVVDNAGNAALSNSRVINVDASAPVLTANYYQKDSGSLLDANGSVYVKAGTQITLYGNYKDVHSGVKNLTFKLGDDSITPAVTFSTDVITTTVNLPTNYAAYDPSYSTAYKSWKAVFSPTTEGRLTAEGENDAGLKTPVTILDIAVDNTAPVVTISAPSDNAKIAYNNFTISGTANDGTGAGLSNEPIKLYYTKTEPAKDSNGTYTAPASSAGWTELANNIIAGSTWSYTTTLLDSVTPNNENTAIWFMASAKDNAGSGNTGYSVPRKITVDRVKPVYDSSQASIGGKTHAQMTASPTPWHTESTLTITGSFTDTNGSGVDKIIVQRDSAPSVEIPTTNGSFTTNISGFTTDSTLTIKAIDKVGLESTVQTYTVKVDSSAPLVTASHYKKGTGSVQEAGGIIYAKSGTQITLYGNYKDLQSGVSALKLFKNYDDETNRTEIPAATGTTAGVTFTYSTTEIPAEESSYAPYNTTSASAYKSWKAVFSTSTNVSGNLTVEGTNVAGLSSHVSACNITIDDVAPVIDSNNIRLKQIDSAGITDAYFKSSNSKYYINNTTAAGKTFKITGVVSDNNYVVESLSISVTNSTGASLTISPISDASGTFEFALNGISEWDEDDEASAVITATDKAGNVTTTQLNPLKIVFDSTPPEAMHWADAKNKDIYFRIGKADNDKNADGTLWETYDSVGSSDDVRNQEVGGKYSHGSWGNSNKIDISGNFYENANGSGLKTIHYAILNNPPSQEQINTLISGGSLTPGSNHVVAVGTIDPLATPEVKNVPYNKDTSGHKAAKLVESNFKKTNLSGFNSDNNYLILVAEDNAGNRAPDELKVTQKTGTDGTNSAADNSPDYTDAEHTNTWNESNSYYSIKKDTDAPSITSSQTETIYTDGNAAADAISVAGTVNDGTGAGVDRVILTISGISTFSHTITSSEISDGNWSYNIPASTFSSSADGTSYQIKATAKDLAGEGNLTEITARTVFVDKKGPVITISAPAQTAKVGATNFAISGNANDGNGAGLSTAAGSMKLYYTTNDTLGSATTAPQSITTGTVPASSWVELTDGAITVNADNTWQSSSTSPYSLTSISTPNENTNLYFIVSAKDSSGTGNTGYSIPRKITVDRKTPVFVSGTAGGSSNAETWLNTRTINISGSYTDPETGSGENAIDGSGVSTIKYQVGSAAEQSLPTSDGSYDKTISLANSVTQETIKVWAVDAAGNEISETDTTNRKSYTIKIDTAAPSLTANYYRRGSDTSVPLAASSGTIYMKSQAGGTSFTLYGNYTDSTGGSGIKQLKIKKDGVEIPAANLTSLLYSEEEITGTNGTVPADSTYGTYSAASATSYKSWKAVFTVTAGGRITVEGEDIAGNTVSASALDITIDDTPPEVSNVKLNVTTGTGSSAVTNEVYSATTTSAGTTTKTYYLNNTVSGKTFTVTGLATDNVGLQSAVLNIVNTATSPATALTRTASNPNGSLSFTVGNWSGWTTGATATITLTDKAGNTATSDALNISFDTVAPLVNNTKLKTPTAIQTESSLFKFEGEAACVHPTETDTVFSGYDKVDILFTTSASAPAANAAAQATANVATNGSWSSTVEFGNTDTFGNVFVSSNGTAIEGTKYLWVRAYDNAGNVGGWVSKDFVYDTKTPSISFTPTASNKNPAADSYRSAGFTLEADASDSYGVQKVEVLYTTQAGAQTKQMPLNSDGKYEFAFVTGSANSSADNYLADGTYTFTVRVTDNSEKPNTVSRSFSIDTTAPVIDMTNTSVTRGADYIASNIGWHKTNQIPVSVSVSDSGAGIGAVQVSTDTGFTNPTNLMQSESGSWTGTIVCGAQGANTIYIKATDAVGNATNVVNANSLPVYIDTTAPADPIFLGISTGSGDSLTATPASQITSVLVNKTVPVTVYAALVDDGTSTTWTGIRAEAPTTSDEKAFVQKGKDRTSTYLASSSALPEAIRTALPDDVTSDYKFWSYEIATTDMKSGGVNFTVKDNAGNEADYVLFQMTVDNTPPTATFNPISNLNLERANDTTVYVNGTITLSGTANDNQKLDSVKVEYKKQGATTWTEIPAPANASLASWTRTLDTTTLEDETEYDIRVSATDSAGNSTDNSATSTTVAARTQTVKVSQDTDRPIIKFTNLSLPATMSATGRISFRNEELYGNVTDDDGIPRSLEYYYGTGTPADSDWKTTPNLSYSSGSFTLKFKDADDKNDDGEHHLYFRVTDASGTTGKAFKSQGVVTAASTLPDIPKVIDNSTSNKFGYITRSNTTPVTYSSTTTVTYLTVDTTDPYRGNLKFSTDYNESTPTWQEKTDITAIPFGGDRNSFKIKIPAWDVNGVTITMTIEGYTGNITFTETTESAEDAIYTEAKYWESSVITIPSTMETGVKACNIDVFDGVRHNKDDFSISVDNTVPVINAAAPSSTQNSSGNVIAYGETDLTYWKNTSATDTPREYMYYALSLDNETEPAENQAASSDDSANTITSWKQYTNAGESTVTTTTVPAGSNASIRFKPYYSPIKGGSFSWYVHFDGAASTDGETHDKTFKQFLIDSGITTLQAIENTNQSQKFKAVVRAYLWIKAVDQVGNETVIKHPILIDPQGDAPKVTIDYPEAEGTTLGDEVTLRGSAVDTLGTTTTDASGATVSNIGVESVWVQLISAKYNGYDSTTSTTSGSRTAGGLSFSDTVTPSTENGTTTYSHEYSLTDFAPTMKDVKQWINTVDGSGHKVYEVYTGILTDSPTHVTAVGNDAAWADDADGTNYYIKASVSGSSWNLKINSVKEFDPAEGQLNPVAYRVFAEDKDGNLSSYEQQLSVFDSDNPIVGSLYLRQYSDNNAGTGTVTASRLYEDDVWVKGKWWLYGSVKDTQGLSSLTINGNTVTITGTSTNSDTPQDFNFKLDTDVADSAGNLTVTIIAEDNATNQTHKTTKRCSINYDNVNPTLLPSTGEKYNISTSVMNSNGFYSFGSQVTENSVNGQEQSGFDYLAFWFERNITGKRVVYDVMKPKVSGENSFNSEISYSDLSLDSGLMWKTKTGVGRSSTARDTLTLSAADDNIHTGGLCKVAGAIYIINNISEDGRTITINGQPEYTSATETVYFAIANVVNNNVEAGSGAKNAAGYYNTLSNDDGDHMVESVSKQGAVWTWEANINSQNIADGSIILHYVAFDKAGNLATADVSNANVKNNAPRLASLEVWSDFNENGTKDAGESDTKYYNGKERKLGGSYGTRATAVTSELIVSGNDKDYTVAEGETEYGSAFMTVKATTTFIPELVGGNGALYYTYKYGDKEHLGTAAVNYGAATIGNGNDDGIDEDINSTGYYQADQNGSAYIVGNKSHQMVIYGGSADSTTDDDSYTLNALNNSASATDPTWFEYTIYDSTEGCADWGSTPTSSSTTGRLSAKFRVALNVQYRDSTSPVVKIRPFYWNSLTENSVDKPANPASFADLRGHIELEGDLPALNTGVSGLDDSDPKVSGVIRIEGYAFDDIKLKELYVQMSNHTNLKGSGSNGVKVASYNGSWTTTSHAADAGWDFTAADVYCNGDGHLVRWTLTVDTAKRDTPAQTEQTVVVYAVDARGSSDTNTSEHDGSTQTALSTYRWGAVKNQENASSTYFKDFWCYRNVDNEITDSAIVYKEADKASMTYYYKMDIVPYVTSVETGLSRYKNSNWSVYNRTALGHYPVQSVVTNAGTGINLKTTTSENVTLYGFNLNHSSATFTSGSSTFTTEATGNLKITNSTDTETQLHTLSFNVAELQTGRLNLTVSDIPLMNNSNKNEAMGTANEAGNSNANYYNLQPNGDTNNIQNDDVEFDVWEFNDRAAVPLNGLATGINMEINQTTKMLNYAFANGGLWYNMGGNTTNTQPAYSETDSYSSYYWAGDWDTFAGPCVGFHVDELGYTYSVASGGDTNNSGAADKYTLFTSRWGVGDHGTAGTYGTNENDYSKNSIRLGYIANKTGDGTYDYDLMKYRYLSSEFASSVRGTDTNLYLVYYDALTNQIRFKAGTFTGNTRDRNVGGFVDEARNEKPSYYNNTNSQIIANGSEATTFKTSKDKTVTVTGIAGRGAGQYVDVAVVKNGTSDVVCVVWFDSEANCCKFSYIIDPITNWNQLKGDATAKNWSTPKTIFAEGGEYCHIVADKNNHLHIAAYAGNGDVKYAYISEYNAYDAANSTVPTCTVDASGTVGEHLTLDVAVVGTGANEHSIPYIGYFTSAIKMPKYAYLVDKTTGFSQTAAGVDTDERFTGNWEVTVVPSPSRMTTNREDKVNIGVWKNAGVLTTSTKRTSTRGGNLNGYSSTNWSKTFGNGTSNAVLGYQISTSSGSCLETAQKR